jgi:hypothetical protein
MKDELKVIYESLYTENAKRYDPDDPHAIISASDLFWGAIRVATDQKYNAIKKEIEEGQWDEDYILSWSDICEEVMEEYEEVLRHIPGQKHIQEIKEFDVIQKIRDSLSGAGQAKDLF